MMKLLALVLLGTVSTCSASNLPIVDLGYELHQAISFDSTQGLYNFSNIRYAAPPVGDLRFRAPVAPARNRTKVQNGTVGRVCPQAVPIWVQDIEPEFLLSVLEGTQFNQSANISSYPYMPTKPDPRTTEDCLFLDVIVPENVFNRSRSGRISLRKSLAPVLVWIDGGGFVQGDKTQLDPSGLVNRSTVAGDGVVFVSINYRLGAFGWLGGHSLMANGTANAGLHDQRFALDWISKNIHLFGGDPNQVTIMGLSAGGGSVMHQITAYGGQNGSVPFQQAIVQSPGWVATPDDQQPEQALRQFLKLLNVSTIAEARNLPSKKLIAANAYQIATKSAWGEFVYTPVVDGTFVPKLPGQLLLEGGYDHNLTVMVGHTSNEGVEFTSPDSRNSITYLSTLLNKSYPFIKSNVTRYITDVLYPPVYDGSYGYNSPFTRVAVVNAESSIQCNLEYLNWAYGNQTFAYEFSVPPGIHGLDAIYVFYNKGQASVDGNLSGLEVQNETVALVVQDYITSFAQFGAPKSSLGPAFKRYGSQNILLNIGNQTIQPMRDTTNASRCHFWQTAPYY
ncbi:hypothetical protein N7493_002568 [Penicillium malachiteum]|uniref:Carboxylic ester hydrolase n=1 Tax=Penicillium malachiteum TaxID=1324776 RepID=A0AAD6MYV9_9EURO|nr:hypothetical protein N7493_002568 [Penicillium malachiteum]